MKKSTNGHGTLTLHGDVTQLRMIGTAAYPAQERGTHLVRIVMRDRLPGGAEIELRLSPEEAANFASTIYSLARTAIIRNEQEAVPTDNSSPVLHAVAA